jgi:hypothetical protein
MFSLTGKQTSRILPEAEAIPFFINPHWNKGFVTEWVKLA